MGCEGLGRDCRCPNLQCRGTAPNNLNVRLHQVVQVTGVTLKHNESRSLVHQQDRTNKTHEQTTNSTLTCWPLIVATGIDGVVVLFSIVTVMWPGTLGGMGICPWLEAGAGAISRLGIGDFRTALWEGKKIKNKKIKNRFLVLDAWC